MIGIANFLRNFKGINLTGYSQRWNNLVVILFNSNFENLKSSELKEQTDWYKRTISNYESDSTIYFIIVWIRHSP